MFDFDQFEERAAIMEFDGGMKRFEAETAAAKAQGKNRWEVLDAISKRNSARGGNINPQPNRNATVNLSGVQPTSKEQKGSVPIGDVPAGRGAMDVSPLRMDRGAVL